MGKLGPQQGPGALMTLALGLGFAPRALFLALNHGLGLEAEALALGAAQGRAPWKVLDEGRSRGNAHQAKALGGEHLIMSGLMVLRKESTLFLRPGPSWVPCECSIGPREATMRSWGGQLGGHHAHVSGRGSWPGRQARVERTRWASLAIHWVGDPHRSIVGPCCSWVPQSCCSIHRLTKVGGRALGKLKMQSRTFRTLVDKILPGRYLVLLAAAAAAAAHEQVQAQ